MRTIPALALSSIVLATLTACTGGPFTAGCAPLVSGGAASTLVDAPGDIGSAPTVDFPTPIISDGIETDTIIHGDGRTVNAGDTVTIKYSLYNGATGQGLGSSGYAHDGDLLTLGSANAADVVSDSLECVTVGSRIAIVASALAVHGGQGDASIGVGPNDSIVYVIDVVDAYPNQANGAPQPAQAGMPSVVTAPGGAPGISIPRLAAPVEVAVAQLKIGSGNELTAGDRVLAKFTSVNWDTGTVVDSTWTTGRATIIPLSDGGSVPQPVVDALTGSTVDSQVLVVIPAGDTSANTLVYVVDVLGILPATD
ncbi:MAG TPA: hypothetical protein PK890_08165 [Terrimesophilobacter sp.]|nr:hypothetical protein [Terrimesophilobacter sp.]